MRVALFGGSFDPVHQGHLVVAELVRQAEQLDRVVFMPAVRSPHKQASVASAADRLAMLRRAVRDNPAFRVSNLEMRRPGPSYTIDTVRAWRRTHPDKPWLLLGGDTLLDLHTWREWRALLDEAHVLVFARPGATAARVRARRLGVRYHELALVSTSSSELRQALRRQQSVRYQMPEAVRRYIEARRLYGWRGGGAR